MRLIIFIVTMIWVLLFILSVYIIKRVLNPIDADITKLKTDRNINNIMKENRRIIKKAIKEASKNGQYSVIVSDGYFYFDYLCDKHEIKDLFNYENELNSLINELKSKGYNVVLDKDKSDWKWSRCIKISWSEEHDK